MALEQLPDVVLHLWPDFTLSSVNAAYKEFRNEDFLSCQESLEILFFLNFTKVSF